MDLTDEPHVVPIGYPSRNVLYVASCRCGWRVGYDPTSHAQAVERALDHVEDERARELMERHGIPTEELEC